MTLTAYQLNAAELFTTILSSTAIKTIILGKWTRVNGKLSFVTVWEGLARNHADAKRIYRASRTALAETVPGVKNGVIVDASYWLYIDAQRAKAVR